MSVLLSSKLLYVLLLFRIETLLPPISQLVLKRMKINFFSGTTYLVRMRGWFSVHRNLYPTLLWLCEGGFDPSSQKPNSTFLLVKSPLIVQEYPSLISFLLFVLLFLSNLAQSILHTRHRCASSNTVLLTHLPVRLVDLPLQSLTRCDFGRNNDILVVPTIVNCKIARSSSESKRQPPPITGRLHHACAPTVPDSMPFQSAVEYFVFSVNDPLLHGRNPNSGDAVLHQSQVSA